MYLLKFVLVTFATLFDIDAKYLLWSQQEFAIPTMKYFDENKLNDLKYKLNVTDVLMYETNFNTFDTRLQKLLSNKYYTAFTLNGDISNFANIKDLNVTNGKTLEDYIRIINNNNNANYMGIIYEKKRYKRANGNGLSFKAESVMINAEVLTLDGSYTCNITEEGNSPAIIRVEEQNKILQADAKCGEQPIKIAFIFIIKISRWYLSNMEVTIDSKVIKFGLNFNLVAAHNWSYYCPHSLKFKNLENNIRLIATGLHLQPDVTDENFSNAYICDEFVSANVFCSILLSIIMILGVGVSVLALSSIKVTKGCKVIREPIYAHPDTLD